jgi:tetratricopeptide (TPR) repeat protein
VPTYIVSGIDDRGRKITERVDAANPLGAVQIFRDRGHENVALETEEIDAVVRNQFEKMGHSKAAIEFLTAKERVALPKMGGFGRFLFWSRKIFRKNSFSLLIIFSIFLSRRYYKIPLNHWDAINVTVLLSPFFVAIWITMFGKKKLHDRLMEEVSWCRWDNVLAVLPKLRGIIPPSELAINEAKALAGLGRLPEALTLLEPYSNGKQIPEWMYWARLMGVYFASGDPEKIIECLKKGLALAPNTPVLQIELATAEIRFHRNPRAAKAILNQIEMTRAFPL